MIKRLLVTILFCLLVTSVYAADPGSWDLLDEDCADISDWDDDDSGTGVSEVSPAGQFRMDTNAGAAGNAKAGRSRDIGEIPNTFTFEIKLYHDAIGTNANVDRFQVACYQSDEILFLRVASDGLFIYDTDSGDTEVGTNLVKEGGSAEWQTWRFLVTFGAVGDGVCDVYLKDTTYPDWEKVGTAIPCSYEGGPWTDGDVTMFQRGNTTDNMVSHIDWVKIATGLYDPTETATSAQVIIIPIM